MVARQSSESPGVEQRDKAEVLKLRSLWDALKSPRGAALSLLALVNFAMTLQGFSALERSVRASRPMRPPNRPA